MAGALKDADLREAWSVGGIDLRLRYKSKSVDLVRLKRGCKVGLRAGRERVSDLGGGSTFPIRTPRPAPTYRNHIAAGAATGA
jgi:hypothetical protein